MSFLKRLGQILATVGSMAIGIGPLVSPLFGSKGDPVANAAGVAANDLTLIGQVIVQMETALAGQNGADKRKAAIALVGPIIQSSQAISGKKIADPTMMQLGIGQITDGMVAVLNSIDQDATKLEIHTP